jgi:FKBP-type peptidyl-prolyl cis-trans isomerase FklB
MKFQTSFFVLVITTILACSFNKSTDEFFGTNSSDPVKTLKMKTANDTLSYALGVVWMNNINSLSLNSFSYSLYKGVNDYLRKDTSIMGNYAANKYLDSTIEKVKAKQWPINDSTGTTDAISLRTDIDSFSYALGFSWSMGIYKVGIEKVTPLLIIGLDAAKNKDESVFNAASAKRYLQNYIENIREQEYTPIKNMNKNWLSENRRKDGVVCLSSGIQFKIMKKGFGKAPQNNSIIKCNYQACLINGTVFESANSKNSNNKFFLSGAPKGLIEPLLLMKEGDVWAVYVPYNLAYGSGGILNLVPPFSTIIYEIELLEVTSVD